MPVVDNVQMQFYYEKYAYKKTNGKKRTDANAELFDAVDVNGDGKVNKTDLKQIKSNWKDNGIETLDFDFDGDGDVDDDDATFVKNYDVSVGFDEVIGDKNNFVNYLLKMINKNKKKTTLGKYPNTPKLAEAKALAQKIKAKQAQQIAKLKQQQQAAQKQIEQLKKQQQAAQQALRQQQLMALKAKYKK